MIQRLRGSEKRSMQVPSTHYLGFENGFPFRPGYRDKRCVPLDHGELEHAFDGCGGRYNGSINVVDAVDASRDHDHGAAHGLQFHGEI